MPLDSGTRLGAYEIVSLLGAGGMGEVYRARDTRLQRDVALKILPDLFAHDQERLARFEREATTLAALNHPNIGHVYGFEQHDTTTALVMELVEGDDLATRLTVGPVPIDEALAIATQIAQGLEAAHEQGIVHRDLKPANVKVRLDGTVKILDFGLAKAILGAGGAGRSGGAGGDSFNSPTITSPAMTHAGMILGTAAYMSPEQARGRAVDKRTDIWAFGVLLFEMLAGRRPFDGEDVAETIGAVIHKTPAWDRLPAPTPAPVRAVLSACLEKDPKRRLRDIGDVQLALEGTFNSVATGVAMAAAPAPVTMYRALIIAAVGMIITGAMTATAMWYATRPDPPRITRFAITPTGTASLTPINTDHTVAISPDGSRIVYVGNAGTQLLIRALDELEPTALVNGGLPRAPFFSPDGQWVGFVDTATGPTLRKVATSGGPAVTICAVNGQRLGASWGPDDIIVFGSGDLATGLWRVSAAGGEPQVLTKPNAQHGEADHIFPEFLPDGRSVLFTITASSGTLDAAQIAILDLATGQHSVVLRGGFHARYSPTGHLVYGVSNTLRAVRFDVNRRATTGTPMPVVAQAVTTVAGAANFSMASNGTLVYVPASPTGPSDPRTMVWVDRQGREEPLKMPPNAYLSFALSPDGRRVAVEIDDVGVGSDIWTWDLAGQTLNRLTFASGIERYPVWSPDSRRVLYAARTAERVREGSKFFSQSADGVGTPEEIHKSLGLPTSISPDGAFLVFQEPRAGGQSPVIHQLSLDKERRRTMLIDAPAANFANTNGRVSPDGRWIAYESNESRQPEVYVRPFPNVNGGRWQVSSAGGRTPRWSSSGRELVYLALPSGQNRELDPVMAVAVGAGPTWSAGPPAKLFERSVIGGVFEVSADGKRFLMIDSPNRTETGSVPLTMIVVLHWSEELREKVR